MNAAASAATLAAGTRRRRERAGVQRERHQPAYPLVVAVIGLVAAGVVMVYSASSVRAYFSNDDPATYGIQQLIWAVVGLSLMYVASRMDFRWLRYLSIPAYLGSIALLVAVLIPGIGTEVAGSRRWIQLPAIGFQPAELAKFAIVLYLAHWLDRRGKAAHSFWNGLVPFALLVLPGFVLIAAEPDLGTAGVYAAATLAVFFMAGANLVYLGAIGSAVLAVTVAMVTATPYQLQRVQSFLDPFRDPLHTGYNAIQSLMALALGGITGLGLGASRQKYLYL